MAPRTARTVIAATIAALALATSLTGCSAIAKINDLPSQGDYPTWADAHTAEATSSTLPKPPSFVPHDAVGMYVRKLNSGQAILTFQSSAQPDSSWCTSGTLSGKPKLLANWWPISKLPAEGFVCSPGWQVFEKDGSWFGWNDDAGTSS
jgi:hypothetical protein